MLPCYGLRVQFSLPPSNNSAFTTRTTLLFDFLLPSNYRVRSNSIDTTLISLGTNGAIRMRASNVCICVITIAGALLRSKPTLFGPMSRTLQRFLETDSNHTQEQTPNGAQSETTRMHRNKTASIKRSSKNRRVRDRASDTSSESSACVSHKFTHISL